MTRLRKFIPAVILALCFGAAAVAERTDVYVERGTGYSLLYTEGRYMAGWGSANPTVRTAFATTGHVIPDGSVFFRTDLGTIQTVSAGTWSAATLAGQTLTGATLTAPTITTPTVTSPTVTGSASSGILVSKRCTFTETTATTYTCTIAIPAGAVIEDIQVIGRVLWNGTSASLDVGDTADPDGYFVTVDLKATDLVIGEMLSIKHSALWGGQEGAYIVAASGRRGPAATNFSMSYVAGSNILAVVTEGAADGTAGRTDFVVIYSTPEAVATT